VERHPVHPIIRRILVQTTEPILQTVIPLLRDK